MYLTTSSRYQHSILRQYIYILLLFCHCYVLTESLGMGIGELAKKLQCSFPWDLFNGVFGIGLDVRLWYKGVSANANKLLW